ncbi:MAG: hypothetical protein IT355_00035 [Gemmatimonadaceae bacterium]|nr:hypothetical protein [Gemmatimonadaceae bacterium]
MFLFPFVFLFLLPVAAVPLRAQQLPAGWRALPVLPPAPVTREFESGALPPTEFVRVRQSPVAPLAGLRIDTWLRAAVATDAAPDGDWSGDLRVMPPAGALVTATREFRRVSGVTGAVLYSAVVVKGERARLLRTAFSSSAVVTGPEGRAAKELMLQLARESPDVVHAPTADSPASEPASDAVRTVGASPPVAAPPAATPVRAAAGTGVRDADIEAVFYHWDQRYDAFQGLVMDEAVYLLLKDGTVFSRLPESLETFDVIASRAAAPRQWGRWRQERGAYEFSWLIGGTGWRRERGNAVPPSAPGRSLSGRFRSVSTYQLPGGSVGMTLWTDMTFTADGRFTANDERRGTYRIDGYAIELRQADGRVERRPFLVDGDGIILGSGRLSRVKPGP